MSESTPVRYNPPASVWARMQELRPQLTRWLRSNGVDSFELTQHKHRFKLDAGIPLDEAPAYVRDEADRQIDSTTIAMVFDGTLEQFEGWVPLDGKFHGRIFRNLDNTEVPSDRWMAFMAYDNALPATLAFYRQECERIGAGEEQLAAVDRLIHRVAEYRRLHPETHKVPDAEPGECH